jgi:phosphatidylcholine synthase
VAAALVTVLAFLTFVPTKYLYPTQPGRLNRVTVILAGPWTLMLVAICAGYGALTLPSLYFPAFYMVASWWVTLGRLPKNTKPVGAADERQ